MAEPNLPLNVPMTNHGQYDGIDDRPLIEDRKKLGFSQTFRGRGRRELNGKGTIPEAAMRYDGEGPV